MDSENINQNAKGQLLELLAKNLNIVGVKFGTTNVAPFVCTLRAEMINSSQPLVVLSSEPFTTKKQAEQDAARKMLCSVAFFRLFPSNLGVTQVGPASGSSESDLNDARLLTSNTSSDREMTAQISLAASSSDYNGKGPSGAYLMNNSVSLQSTQDINAKGKLLEHSKKNPKLSVTFDPFTMSVAPFVCTLTVATTVNEGGKITVRSGECTRKNLAERDAAWQMLQHPMFPQLVAMAAGNWSSIPAISPAKPSVMLASMQVHDNIARSAALLSSPCAAAPVPAHNTDQPPVRIQTPSPDLSSTVRSQYDATDTSVKSSPLLSSFEAVVDDLEKLSVPPSSDSPTASLSRQGVELVVDTASHSASAPLMDANTPESVAESVSSGGSTGDSVQSEFIGSTTASSPFNLTSLSTISSPVASSHGQKQEECEEEKITNVVQCAACNGVLGSVNQFCFYQKTETDIEFTVKHDVVSRLLFMHTEGSADSSTEPTAERPHLRFEDRLETDNSGGGSTESTLKSRVICAHCDAAVGHKMQTGPEGATQCTIGGGKVIVFGVKVKSWSKVKDMESFKQIEWRNAGTFHNGTLMHNRLQSRPFNQHPVVFPIIVDGQPDNSPDYEYSDLLDSGCGKVPREEQVTALHVCLQHNAIVVFPTGFGKTLVASMVMHRYRRLNPRKLVVMVEERVTLVQQQNSVIIRDTGMTSLPISGNNATRYVLSELLSGKFDALIITAGVLHNYLSQGLLRVSDFSLVVFDECHHTNSEHLYKKIIDKIAQCPEKLRPRVVGLTASPLKARDVQAAYIELDELRSSFLGATVYRPQVINEVKDIVRHAVHLSEEQQALQRALVAELQSLVDQLLQYLKTHRQEDYKTLVGKRPIVLSPDGSPDEWKRVTGCAADVHYNNKGSNADKDAAELAKKCRVLVRYLNDNYLLGPAFVHRSNTDSVGAIDETLISGQVRALCDLLTERGSASFTLVFVETRNCAKIVLAFLKSKYLELNCSHVFGQGGDDGMQWKQQERVLIDFRRGTCRLVVCTTVLEEGLDVKGCNLVIRLGGAPTLIQVVQSKGRARDKNGELHLIFTREEQAHFDKLVEQEVMQENVLTGSAARVEKSDERFYIKDFMKRSEQELQRCDESDCDSVLSSDSQDGFRAVGYQYSEDGNTPEGEKQVHGTRGHGITLLICANGPDTQKLLESNLKNQVSCVSVLTKCSLHSGDARTVVSDPRMFLMSDSVAVVSVTSTVNNFLRYFSSVWDFTVGTAPAYILLPPSVKESVKSTASNESSAPTSPTVRKESTEHTEQLTVLSAQETRLFSLSDLKDVSVGWLVGRQHFMSAGQLGSAAPVPYSTVRIEQGRTLLLEAAPVEDSADGGGEVIERTCVRIPATTLAKYAIVSATHSSKTVIVYLTLTSTPSVFFEPKHKRCSKAGEQEYSPFKISKDCRVCSPNQQQHNAKTGEQSAASAAQKDLQLLAMAPVIALTFPLAKWSRLKRVFTDPAVLGLSVLVTRVGMPQYLLPDYRQLVMDAPSDSARLCQYTYATLVSDVYVSALNPAVLDKIKEYIINAGHDERLLQIASAAMLQLHKHLKLSDLWQDAYAYFQTACTTLEKRSHVAGDHISALVSDNSNLPEGYVLMKRIQATPSRLQLMPPVPTMSNRLIRMLGDKYQLTYVKFRDEQGQAVYNEALFGGRFLDMLINGFDVCGTTFRFLLCSNSQLREATAVFFDGSDEDVAAIRA